MLSKIVAKTRSIYQKTQFKFSEILDPYYILGVDRSMSYDQIKKEYFKLAQKYHPDINQDTDSAAKFIQIKQAFENIKMQNGKMVVQSFEGSRQPRQKYQSQRPDAQQYQESDTTTDAKMNYQEFVFRTPKGQQYDKYRESFMTMHEINDKYFRPIQNVNMPDPAKRFGLQNLEVKIKTFGDRGQHFIIVFSVVASILFLILNKNVNEYMIEQYENMFYNMLNKEEFEHFQKTQDEIDMSITQNFKEQKRTKENIERIRKMEKLGQAKMDSYVPRFHEYTSLEDIRKNINENKS